MARNRQRQSRRRASSLCSSTSLSGSQWRGHSSGLGVGPGLEALPLGVLRCKLSPSLPHRPQRHSRQRHPSLACARLCPPAQSWRVRWKMWQEFLHLFLRPQFRLISWPSVFGNRLFVNRQSVVPRTILPPPCQLFSETIMFPPLTWPRMLGTAIKAGNRRPFSCKDSRRICRGGSRAPDTAQTYNHSHARKKILRKK